VKITSIAKSSLRKRAGLYTIREVVDMLGADYHAFYWRMRQGDYIQPHVRIGERPQLYYTRADVDTIKEGLCQ